MADVPVGSVPAPAVSTPTAKPSPVAARAAKLASVNAGLAKLQSETPSTAAPAGSAEGGAPNTPAAPEQSSTPIEKPAEEKKAEPEAVEAKPDEPKTEKPAEEEVDAKTAKALAAVDKQAKRFRDEQASARKAFESEMAQARAEFARERAEFQAKYAPADELSKLVKQDPIAALRKLGIDSEDDWERIGRGAFPFTKAGKADPRSREVAEQTQHKSQVSAELAELKKQNEELRRMFETTQQRQAAQVSIERWTTDAVKAIPAEPTLIGKLHAKSPEKAKQTLLAIGQQMEREAMEAEGASKYDPSHTPSHADVIKRYEELRRAELEEQGVDVDALLRPAAIKVAEAKPSKTLDVTATSTGTRPINGHASRAEKLAAIERDLRKREAETA